MNSICRITALVLLFSLAALASPGNADLVTIDFDSFAPTTSFGGGTEEGFVIGNVLGPVAVNSDFLGPFSGANSIHHNSASLASFEITHEMGSLFELESFRAGSAFGGAEPLTISGFVGGALVGSDVYDPNPADSYFLFNPTNLLGVQVDRLVFDLGPAGPGPTHIDDIIVNGPNAVPEPSAAILGFAGTLALITRRRR